MLFCKKILTAVLILLASIYAHAGNVLEAKVENKDKRYFVSLEVILNADTQRVYDLLTDYDKLTLISDSIKESSILYSLSDKDHRVSITTKACVTFFCKTIHQVQDVEELPGMVIVTTSIPTKSDVDYAHARWKITAEDGLTRVNYSSDLKPSFWVPPVIGPPLIESALRSEALAVIEGLENQAQKR